MVWLGTVCTTFSRARTQGSGPRPLRSKEFPYGFSKSYYTQKEYEQLRIGTFFALQSADFSARCMAMGVAVCLENPEPWDPNSVSIWDLNEFEALMYDTRVSIVNFDHPIAQINQKPSIS